MIHFSTETSRTIFFRYAQIRTLASRVRELWDWGVFDDELAAMAWWLLATKQPQNQPSCNSLI
jgi:hypothetical protein